MELKNMVAMICRSRTGRHLQRYNEGCRQVVGCIPYRFKKGTKKDSELKEEEDSFEVLVISAQRKGKGMLFPKGGWEIDESMEDAALRETIEEAGVTGDVEVSASEAMRVCQQDWMKEALRLLVIRLTSQEDSEAINEECCSHNNQDWRSNL